ncbi:hypothetical protein ACFL6I_09475 [candidate division KSB1 bacterium]
MGIKYSEVIMIGRFNLIKGFVHGYFLGQFKPQRPFFHMKSGTIKRDTILGTLKSLLDMENRVPFCIRDDMLEDFKKAAEIAYQRFGIYIKDIKKVVSAQFEFEHAIYNPELGKACKDLIVHLPKGVDIFDYIPEEETHDEYASMKLKGTAHSYSYTGKGIVYGEFEPVIDFFLMIRQSRCAEFINCQDLKLNFEE